MAVPCGGAGAPNGSAGAKLNNYDSIVSEAVDLRERLAVTESRVVRVALRCRDPKRFLCDLRDSSARPGVARATNTHYYYSVYNIIHNDVCLLISTRTINFL